MEYRIIGPTTAPEVEIALNNLSEAQDGWRLLHLVPADGGGHPRFVAVVGRD